MNARLCSGRDAIFIAPPAQNRTCGFPAYGSSERLRPKPPAGLPTINAGEPWSPMDLADLDEFITSGKSVELIAEYLCRPVDEVEAKIASLRN
jgi:hypothetical protein